MGSRGKVRALLTLGIACSLAYFAYDKGYLASYAKITGFPGNQGSKLLAGDFEFKEAVVRNMRQTVLATGTVTLKIGAEVKIGSRVSGQLESLFVRIGDFVRAGQKIAVVEHEDWKARVARRNADLQAERARLEKIRQEGPLEIAKARAELEQQDAQLKLAEKMLERNRELSGQGVIAPQVLEKSDEDLQVLRAKIKLAEEDLRLRETRLGLDIRLAEANVQKALADLREQQTQLAYATITASIDGIVASISTQKGETVAASLSAPTFVTLVDLRMLEVTVYVDETDIGRVREGQEAKFTVDSYPDRFFQGTVREIYPKAVIKDNVVNYQVILEVEEDGKKLLRPEMTANVIITTDSKSGALAVPREAVKRKGKDEFVVVDVGGKPTDVQVKTGWRDAGDIEIVSGIGAGDRVGIPLKPSAEKTGSRRDVRRS
jgi:HlyD family secretion protein/macrolide-specific efflux system membrane fusion protein